ncbi:SaV-like [uncultured Caudovirales phage]|uniref:SaV-like n=1 Tax=uncultured Caudovirales phage TaxID=2100421 RepID=A0A6J7XMF4_9CAUD|nr:SaV-like [uncultured Caudovirales phage]
MNDEPCSACGEIHNYPNDDSDPVNNPAHYNISPASCSICGERIECIDVAQHMNFNKGNAIKYIWRAGLKTEDEVEDLRKAIWYLGKEIERLKS